MLNKTGTCSANQRLLFPTEIEKNMSTFPKRLVTLDHLSTLYLKQIRIPRTSHDVVLRSHVKFLVSLVRRKRPRVRTKIRTTVGYLPCRFLLKRKTTKRKFRWSLVGEKPAPQLNQQLPGLNSPTPFSE